MKHLALLLLLAPLAACGTTRVTAVGGFKDLGSDLRQFRVDHQTVVGAEVSSVPADGGFGFELGGHFGEDTGANGGVNYKSESTEFYAGPRYEWHHGRWSPYIALGISALSLRGSSDVAPSKTDTDLGYYATGGVDYRFQNGLFVGGSVRGTFDQTVDAFGVQTDADSIQGLLRFGYQF